MMIKLLAKENSISAKNSVSKEFMVHVYSNIESYSTHRIFEESDDGICHNLFDLILRFKNGDNVTFNLNMYDYVYIMNDEGQTIDKIVL